MLDDYSYFLPRELIAQRPVRPRDSARLMHVKESVRHLVFRDIAGFFSAGDVLVVNDARVSACKLYGKKVSGAPADVIIEAREGDFYRCRLNANRIRIGHRFVFHGLKAEVVSRKGDLFYMEFEGDVEAVLREHGCLAQPNYIRSLENDEHYQTVYAKRSGSFAAPTAGLHFTHELLLGLCRRGVLIAPLSLHVSFGTFTPIDGPVETHTMDTEEYFIPEKTAEIINNRKGRLFVCGTTSLKALESSADNGLIVPGHSSSDLFIYPGHKFQVAPDYMITNFHFPKSTLLLMVCALFGRERVLSAYQEAVRQKYRFYSLGDACLFENSQPQ